MSEAKLESYFFTAILLITLIVVGVLFYPYVGSLAMAIVLATLSGPFHRKVRKRIASKNISAMLVTLLLTIAIVGPAIGLSFLLVDEAKDVVAHVDEYNFNYLPDAFESLKSNFTGIFPALEEVTFTDFLEGSLENIKSLFAGAVSFTAEFIIKFFVFLIALYYFIKDGNRFLNEVIRLSPLEDSEDVAIVHKLEKVAHSLLRGTLVIAVLQGLLMGVGFLIFGISNPVLWGSVAAISALIPTLGTGIVSAPAIIYLFLSGKIAAGVGLLAWAALVVGLVDNVIGPKLIGNGAKIHPLFVLLSVLGGIKLFGLSGFVLGPLLFGFLMALAEIYKVKIKEMHRSLERM